MSKFLTDLDMTVLDDNTYRLDSPLVYQSDIIGGHITVPAGFVTDLASVPRVPFVYMFWGGRAHREAVIHDYLYRTDAVPIVTFDQANEIFLEAMKCREKSYFVAYPMFWGVKLGGASSWHKKGVQDGLSV